MRERKGYKIIVSDKFKEIGTTRYIVVDADFPKRVLDDACGYGYGSEEQAEAGYSHKMESVYKRREDALKEEKRKRGRQSKDYTNVPVLTDAVLGKPIGRRKKPALQKRIRTFCEKHRDFINTLYEIKMFGPGVFTPVQAEYYFKEAGIEPEKCDFTMEQFLRHWEKYLEND